MSKPRAVWANWGATLFRGALVGLAATQALDWLSIALYEGEDRSTRRAEDCARGHRHAYEVAVDRATRARGLVLRERDLKVWSWRFHKVFGVLGGVGYLLARRRYPKLGAGYGLAFGTAFFLLIDEGVVPGLRLTPGPRAFSWKVHARGAVSHLAYGVAAEAVARALEPEPTPNAALRA